MLVDVLPILSEFMTTPGFLEIIGLLLVVGMLLGAWLYDRRYTFWNLATIMVIVFMFSEVLRRVFLTAQGSPPSLRPLLLSALVVTTILIGIGIGVRAVKRGREPFVDNSARLEALLNQVLDELGRGEQEAPVYGETGKLPDLDEGN